MSPRLILRPPVVQDMEEHAVHLCQRSPEAADRFLEACCAEFEKLAAMPGKGRLREFRNPKAAHIRSWPLSGFANHLIFYRPIEDGIEVLRVLHGARDIDALFEE